MPLPITVVQQFLQRNPGYVQGRNPQQVMVELAAMDMLPQEPVVVTPGQPAPVQPGVPVAAPPPMATDYRDQSALIAAQTKAPVAESEEEFSLPERPSVDALRQQMEDRNRSAEASATEDPDFQRVLGVLDKREDRLDSEIDLVDKEKKQAMWLAVAMAGARMAQSQSPYFAAALAEGLESGITGFQAAKASAAERKARLVDQQEQAVVQRYDALTKARDAARDREASGLRMTADQIAIANAEDDRLIKAATASSSVKEAKAKARSAEFEAGSQKEKFELEKRAIEARIAQGWAQIAAARERGGGGGGGSSSDYRSIVGAQALIKNAEQLRTLANSTDDKVERDRLYAQANEIQEAALNITLPPGLTQKNPIEWSPGTSALIQPGQFFRRNGKVYRQTPGAGMGDGAGVAPAKRPDPLGIL